MARIIEGTTLYEEIQSVEHTYPRDGHDGIIRCVVGKCNVVGGEVSYVVPQTFQEYTITGSSYDQLALDTNKFNRDDLWGSIDALRAQQ